MRRTAWFWLAGVALVFAACGSSGPASTSPGTTPTVPATAPPATPLPTPSAAATTATSSSASPVPSPAPRPAAFTVSSPSFADGAAIPSKFTCDGAGTSPEVAWSGAPDGTRALAMTVLDPDAGDFVHWLVYDIPGATTGSVAADVGTGPGAPPQGRNSRGDRGYTGPCPPSGRHHYVFTLYALDARLGLSGTPSRSALDAAIKGHVLATAVLTGTYKRS